MAAEGMSAAEEGGNGAAGGGSGLLAEPRAMTSAQREMQEVLEAARALGLEADEASGEEDEEAAKLVADLELDQPVEEDEPDVPSFLTGDEPDEGEDEAAAVAVESVQSEGAAWFAVNTYAGYESRVQDALDKRIRSMDAEQEFVELPGAQDGERKYVLVPTQQEVEIRGGKRREVERKLLPGYVLVQIKLDPKTNRLGNDSWHVVSGTAGVTGFVGSEDQARPLPAEEVASIIGQTRVEEPRVRVGFAVGDRVRLSSGPFLDFIAQVEEINLDKGKVRVLVTMFGRETPVELDLDQVEKE